VDRKELVRKYKEERRPIGIFQVRNKRDGKVFIGSTADLPAMLNRQQAQLRFGGHPVKRLQADWNELGADAFDFEVLDTLKPSEEPGYDPAADLRVLEAMWLEKLSPYDERGYNSRPRTQPQGLRS
jgi:hypothetical protein